MENFVLYEELGKSEHSIIYKGRRKGTISFVAIHCIDKCKRPEVTNTVRMTHDASHPNVVRFHEWYETSNHLWLVVELCTGGSLDKLIQQDGHLPESAIRSFGVNLVHGLHYIHTQGIIFNDLQPAKILLDTPGILKYGDFGLSKVEGENLSELFHKFADAGEQWNPENMDEVYANIRTKGSLTYMAPEVVQGGEPTLISDLWSLGCVFYEMFTGHPPFLAESEEQLKEKIVTKEFTPPKVRGTRFSSKASPDFISILEGLLTKDSVRRLGWAGLVNHPFWQGELAELAKDFEGTQELRSSIATARSSVFEHGGGSALGRIKGVDLHRSMERPISHLEMIDSARPGTAVSDVLRPKTAPGMESCGGLFTLSARPHTAVPPDDKVTTPMQTVRGPVTTREEIEAIRKPIGSEQDSLSTDRSTAEKLKLIFHPSDFTVTPIVDNSKIQKTAPPKYDAKTLPVPPFSVEKVLSLTDMEQEKHIRQVLDTIAAGEKGPPTQKRIHLLNYAATIAASPPIADRLLAANGLAIMGRQIKETTHVEPRVKLGRVMALVANNASHLDDHIQVTEPLMTLTEIVREGVKNSKLKQGLFPALGEILYMVAVQEKKQGRSPDSWNVPSMTYTVVSKYCRDSEDPVLNHIAAKTVENVTTVQGPHAQKFVTNELAQSLWYLFKHSTMDTLRGTALSALCHLTWQSAGVFQSVVDTVGLTSVLGALSLGISRVQQAIVTMFGILVQSGGHLTRLVQDKDFLQKIMRLLESPSMVIRGKAFCVLHDVFSASLDMLIPCQTRMDGSRDVCRLVMYIERDSRRQTPREGREAEETAEYLAQCLEHLVCFICQSVPVIYRDILSALESASGRKHPSAVQVRQLKSSLPLLAILPHLVTSQVFRSRVVTEDFMRDLGILLTHVAHVESGNTNIESVAEKIKASISVPEFVSLVVSILEGVSQHAALVLKFHGTILSSVLPTLASLLAPQNVETKASALRLFSEMASVYLSQDQYNMSEKQVNIGQLHSIITANLLPQYEQILLEQEPLPSSGLKLLLALLDQNPAFIRQVEELALVPVIFQALLDHQNKPLSSAMQSIVGILNCLVCHKETNMRDLYDQGLVDYLSTLFFEVSSVCLLGEDGGRDLKTANAMLQSLLDALHSLLKFLSEVVRKALQARKTGGDGQSKEAEEAETLLMLNKSLTDLTSLLTQLLCYEDCDIQDLATKCLSLLVQLFGGENRDAMSQENMGYYSKALQRPDPKRQKVLLRIIKRLVSTDRHHCEAMREGGEELAQIIKNLVQTASSHADVPLSTLAAEILRSTGFLKGK